MPPMRVRVYTANDITYGHLFLDKDANKIFVDFEDAQYKRVYLQDKIIEKIDVLYPSPQNTRTLGVNTNVM